MVQAIDKKKTVDLNELLTSIIIQEEALVNNRATYGRVRRIAELRSAVR